MASVSTGRVMFYLAVVVWFAALLFAATPTMGPQAAVAALLFWIWVLNPGDRGWGQTAAGLVVILLLAIDGPMPWQWRDPGLPLWLTFGTLVLLPGVLVWRRAAGPRFEEPGANGANG